MTQVLEAVNASLLISFTASQASERTSPRAWRTAPHNAKQFPLFA
jgi:hypothetical protein